MKPLKCVGVLVATLMLNLGGKALAERAVGLGSFVRLGASSRGIALGRAYTALAGDDALGFFWNPAAIALGRRAPRFALSNRFLGDQELGMGGALSFFSVGGSVPLWAGVVVGVGVMHLGVPGIEQYDERAVFGGEFSDSESLVVMSLGHAAGPISVGLNAKLLNQGFTGLQATSGATSGSGVGLDMGIIARFWRPLLLGVTLRDRIDIGRDRAPMTALAGAALDHHVSIGAPARVVTAIDLEQIKNRPLRLHMGIGLEDMPAYGDLLVALRLGRSNRMLEGRLSNLLKGEFRQLLQDPKEDLVGANAQWAFGLGLRKGQLRMDYTFTAGKLHDPQYFSLGYGL